MGSKLLELVNFEEYDSLVPDSDQRTESSHDSTHSRDRPWVLRRRVALAALVVASGLLAVIATRATGLHRGLRRTGSTSEIVMEEHIASTCVDKRRHCRHWAKSGYCHTHASFMQRECCHSCGGGGRCVDIGEHCGYWVQGGHCQSKAAFMRSHCCASCGSGSGCTDSTPRCSAWAQERKCYTHRDYMRSNCCQSCGYGDPPKDAPAHGGGGGGGSIRVSHCKPLSLDLPTEHAINIILVPSAFNGDMAKWRQKAHWMFGVLSQYTPFDAQNIPGLNVLYIDIETHDDDGQHCHFGCHGVDRLLCCPGSSKLLRHAKYHCGSGILMGILIVHNSDVYGGAGMPHKNAASCSTHPESGKIAVHELGHSMFGLGDEYTRGGRGNPDKDPNCDYEGCSKWRDLIGRFGVACKPGRCNGGHWYTSGDTIMNSFQWHFGAVNERIMCCKYLFHTKQTPGFCHRFNEGNLSLGRFCRGRLWKGRYTNLRHAHAQAVSGGSIAPPPLDTSDEERDERLGTRHVHLKNPVAWEIERVPGEGADGWVCVETPQPLVSGVYPREDVMGDPGATGEDVVHVEVLDSAGRVKRRLKFRTEFDIELPPDVHGDFSDEDTTEPLDIITLLLQEGEACRIRASGHPAANGSLPVVSGLPAVLG